MIYSDGVHLISIVSLDHLHEYCKSIEIKRCWYHPGRFKHYDIPKKMRKDFFKNNPEVNKVSSREIVLLLKKKGLV